jgi:hypothetical protein
MQTLPDYQESGCDPRPLQVAHDTTGAAAVRRAKVLKLVEPEEAPVEKPDKNMFDKLSR